MHGATEANGVKRGKSRMGRRRNRKWWISPSCLPRQEGSGTIADMKSAWMSSRRAECYLWQQQESLAHHQVEKSLHKATAELTEGKEFREFRWWEPTPLISLVLSHTVSTLAACLWWCGSYELIFVVCTTSNHCSCIFKVQFLSLSQ